jgi:NADH:ubiquinone oxidoreductase subunit F (NADH-binding)/NADH:ubiquinone oxidoreductase subunit E
VSDWRAALGALPRERTWLLPALPAVQHDLRWIPSDALAAVAAHLRVPASEVYGVATHYPEFRLSEPGKRVVRVCTGVSCRISGGLDCLAALERQLGVRVPATATDGSVTLEPLDCAFNCSMAPVVQADHQDHGRVAIQDLERVLSAPPSGFFWALADDLIAGRSSYPELVSHAQSRAYRGLTFVLAVGSCSLSVGAVETFAALTAEVDRRGLQAAVSPAGCSGLCWAAPMLTVIHPDGTTQLLPHTTADRIPALLDAALAKRVEPDPRVTDFLRRQRRELTSRCGVVNPHDIADAVRRGSYAALAEALAGRSPEHITQTVKAAGLRGRGGAYFAAATKWEGARQAPGSPKYLIVNAEEGEPGIFKDRHLMEGDPHRLFEGALLAAYASGASRIILYVHGEAHLSAERMKDAVASARAWGFVGERILGSDFSVEVEIRRGAGGFVLGEETALMESLEGRRAMPRPKPPFPTEAGLFGKPTVINNVETLFAVPLIAARGEKWWAGLGRGHGTKCFGLSGHVARPGVVEVEMGSTLRDLVERLGGGVPGGRALRGVVVGGPSGTIVPPRDLDEPLLPGGRVNPGTGGLVALDDTVSIRDVIRTLLDFNTRESCGKCTPCREGTARLRDILDTAGAPDGPSIAELAEVVRVASLCGLGQAAPLSILAALRDYPELA